MSNEIKVSESKMYGLHTKWTSHKHPDNPDFMQSVNWHVWEKDGKTTVMYKLDNQNGQGIFIDGLTKEKAIELYTDEPVHEVSEEEFEKWLANR